ncbi:MAG: RluA family pseudouridine synthase [Bacteroidetes bacterium]|jgi:23S rRNA pseudouridine1911/1915/1917 synthase|nr:RluA family pseudouridine synthase [Bacteroidota bacterium]
MTHLESRHGSDDEFFEHYKVVADEEQRLLRIDKFLTNRLKNASRNRIQNAARSGFIRVNGAPVKPNYRVRGGDAVSVVLPHPPRNKELIPEDLSLDFVYEDDHLVVVNKPPGMVVHPGFGNHSGTLVNGLLFHFNQLPKLGGEERRPGLVHRIDKDTSGLLVVAKDEDSLTHLANQFFYHTIDRVYFALVWGNLAHDGGTIDNYLDRSPRDRKLMAVTQNETLGKRAITHYRVLERYGFATAVECRLETGRTHQIRAHFKHLGHPLFHDTAYGGHSYAGYHRGHTFKAFVENTFAILPRQALHARVLGFEHPTNGQKMYFEQPLPPDMQLAQDRFRKFVAKPHISPTKD